MQSRGNECLTISVEEAGYLLGISRGLAYEMVRKGKIPALRFGRRLLVPKMALAHLLSGVGHDDRQSEAE